jgi:hypothetical protein
LKQGSRLLGLGLDKGVLGQEPDLACEEEIPALHAFDRVVRILRELE